MALQTLIERWGKEYNTISLMPRWLQTTGTSCNFCDTCCISVNGTKKWVDPILGAPQFAHLLIFFGILNPMTKRESMKKTIALEIAGEEFEAPSNIGGVAEIYV
ncbi:MAG TPA: hypothetical protein DCY42_04300 [Chloroflexi bacterium]|nr:hypothetical protein [Chloroflexota bacterium]